MYTFTNHTLTNNHIVEYFKIPRTDNQFEVIQNKVIERIENREGYACQLASHMFVPDNNPNSHYFGLLIMTFKKP